MRHRTFRALAGGIAMMLTAGLLVMPVATPASAAPAISWGPCADPPAGIPPAGQQCANLSVPADYTNPGGQQITVAISRIPAANPASRHGVLLFNPGGPGGPGLDLPRIMTILLPQSILNQYDLIGFDPRGIGASTPLTCGLTGLQADQALPMLMQQGSFSATADYAQFVAQSCATHIGSLLPYITTAATARDMDRIRLALGESKISYLGYSYGTYLGAVYASLFPNQTDRFIIDSNVDPLKVWRDQFRSFGTGGDTAFPDFLNYAAANDAQYHFGTTPAAVQQTYFNLLSQLRQHPVTVADGTVLNDAYVQELTFFDLSDAEPEFPDLANTWQTLIAGQTPDLELAPTDDNPVASGLSILCNDAAWSRSPAQYQSELTTDVAAHPAFGAIGSNIWPCAYWAAPTPSQPPITISSQGPAHNILVIQNRRDPVTPYAGGQDMRNILGARAVLLSVDALGHGDAFLERNTCADQAVTDYLTDGTLPATDSSCRGGDTGGHVSPDRSTPSSTTPGYQRAVSFLHHLMHS